MSSLPFKQIRVLAYKKISWHYQEAVNTVKEMMVLAYLARRQALSIIYFAANKHDALRYDIPKKLKNMATFESTFKAIHVRGRVYTETTIPIMSRELSVATNVCLSSMKNYPRQSKIGSGTISDGVNCHGLVLLQPAQI